MQLYQEFNRVLKSNIQGGSATPDLATCFKKGTFVLYLTEPNISSGMGGRGGARASWEGKAEGWRVRGRAMNPSVNEWFMVRGRAMNPSVNEWFMVGGLKAGKDGGRWTEGSRR